VYNIDVSDKEKCKDAAKDFMSTNKGIDIVIANAGVGGDDNILSGDPSEINSILKINLLGVTNSVIPFIPKMKEQHSGRIAIISSIAGFRGLPHHGGYSASKAALRNLTESWNYTLKPYGISLTTIFPGYIDTEMTKDHKFKMPFLMHSDKASRIIANSIQRKRRKLILPWQWKFIIPIFRILPRFLIYRFTPNQKELK
jgi:short-subunit dehydrogenase